jgi:hypothetical protein
MLELYNTSYSETCICSGKICSEGWFILIKTAGNPNKWDDEMLCHLYNDFYNRDGGTHGYSWRIMANSYMIPMSPLIWYKTKEEALSGAMRYIKDILRWRHPNEKVIDNVKL